MAINFQDQGEVSLGRSSISPVDTYVRPTPADNSSKFGELAKAFGELGVNFQNIENNQVNEQMKTSELWVSKLRSTFGDKATEADIENTLSPLHPKVRARISEDYGYLIGKEAAQKTIENTPRETTLDPEGAKGYYDNIRNESLKQTDGSNNIFFRNGYAKAVEQGIEAHSAQDSNERLQKNKALQKDALGSRTYDGADAIYRGKEPPASTTGNVDTVPSVPLQKHSFAPEVNSAIENAANKAGVDPNTLAAFAKIESGGKPNAKTGSYKGLFQLSDAEFNKHGGGNIYSAADNAQAAAVKLKAETNEFKSKYGYEPSAGDLYMVHQQGSAGYAQHLKNPDAPAWKNMLATGEGQQKGERWAKAAIWGNIPDKVKAKFGNVENVTSAQFTGYWKDRVNGDTGTTATALTASKKYADSGQTMTDASVVDPSTPTNAVSPGTPPDTNVVANTDANADTGNSQNNVETPLPPRIQAMRQHFFGLDSEYQKSSTLNRAEIRDEAASSFLRLAIDKRDPAILKALPDEVLTPEIRQKYSEAEHNIATLKWSDYEHARTVKENAQKDEDRSYKDDIVNRLAKGDTIDPATVSRRKDGTFNREAFEYANQQKDANRLSETVSATNSANIEDKIFEAGTTGDYTKLAATYPALKEKVDAGGIPTAADLRDYIRDNPTMNSKDKLTMLGKVDKLMDGMALMQSPEVKEYYNTLLGSDVEAYIKSPAGGAISFTRPGLLGELQRVYASQIRMKIKTSIEADKGVPRGDAKAKMLDEALAVAKAKVR